jgi:1A family penicillin-binding protein
LGPWERLLRRALRLLWWTGSRAALVGLLALAAVTTYYYTRLPDLETLLDGRAGGSLTLVDASGEVFAWRGEQMGMVRAQDVSPHLLHAIVATEDRRFYGHFGIDIRGTLRAALVNLRAGGVVQGGSSLTQQVAKLIFFDNTRTLERKLKEVPAALALEWKFSKDEILSIYLNRVYLGAGATGFEAAAQRYFNQSAATVSPAEAAMLAGLLRAPSRLAPTNDLDRAQDRAATIVALMQEEGYLSDAQAREAQARPAVLSAAAAEQAGADFADWVISSGPDFLTRSTSEDIVVFTTFDPRVQRAAEAALKSVFDARVREGSEAQAAVVIMSPDGAVRAMIGGRGNAGEGRFNRATQAKRQTGSLFKPFVYAAALQAGARPSDQVMDAPLTLEIPGSGSWSPQNYSRSYRGQIDLTEALAQSVNTAAVRVSEGTGRERVRAVAEDLGVETPIVSGPALALGTSEATLLEMTGAYAGILSGGIRIEPYGLRELRLRADASQIMGGKPADHARVLDARTANDLIWMMSQVLEGGTGARAKLPERPAAGKTGTTQAARDAWFIGFTADYVAGVWMGYDDNTPLTGVTGGGLPAAIWQETMLRVHEGLPVRPLPMSIPDAGRPGGAVASGPAPAGVPGTVTGTNVERVVRSVFNDVLRGLLGRN